MGAGSRGRFPKFSQDCTRTAPLAVYFDLLILNYELLAGSLVHLTFLTLYIILYIEYDMLVLEDKEFTWVGQKNRDNIKKHGISFQEAVPVFLDPYLVVVYDNEHSSQGELRWKGIGLLGNSLLLSIVFIEEDDAKIRLISAREASPKEKKDYGENIRQIFGH